MPNNKIDSQATPDTGITRVKAGGTEEVSEISSQRRKLIKASAAAIPAVMTLRSGAASAMSAYGCTTHDNTLARNEPAAQVLDPDINGALTHDHWIRVPGLRVPIPGGGGSVAYCINIQGTYTCYDENGQPYTGSGNSSWNDNFIENHGDNVALLAYLNFDANGDDTGEQELFYPLIQTVTPAPPGYSPLTYSCLSSIHPAFEPLGGL